MEFEKAISDAERNISFQGPDLGLTPKDSWPMMDSILPSTVLTLAYLFFVTFIGPKFMENRRPYNLKAVMFIYNLFQVVFSFWLAFKGVKETYGTFMEVSCTPSLLSPETQYEVDSVIWYYMLSKYVEFLDTIFFILRQKWNQVTFLHVYHHANMAIFTWIYMKYINGIQVLLIAVFNSFVHGVMYGYYLLSGLGPEVSKFLWWKKYITKLQIAQFITIITYSLYLYLKECNTRTGYIPFTICNTSSFLILFMMFYSKAYSRKKIE